MRLASVLALVLLSLIGLFMTRVWWSGRSYHSNKCEITHAPKKGCPAGSTVLHDFFTEPDGTHIDGCKRHTLNSCIDEVRPGERVAWALRYKEN
jgi:hypothetical protein